jgi:hypothetical protein
MNRRSFAITLAGAAAASGCGATPGVKLRAIVTARMPEDLLLSRESIPAAPILEIRVYEGCGRGFTDRLAAAGVPRAALETRGSRVICTLPFQDLAARAQMWTRINSGAEWAAVAPAFASYRFGLYRVTGS